MLKIFLIIEEYNYLNSCIYFNHLALCGFLYIILQHIKRTKYILYSNEFLNNSTNVIRKVLLVKNTNRQKIIFVQYI